MTTGQVQPNQSPQPSTLVYPRRLSLAFRMMAGVPDGYWTVFDKCSNLPPGGTNQCKRAWGSFHTQGQLNFVMCDGSARTIQVNIDMSYLLPALASISGGEPFELTD